MLGALRVQQRQRRVDAGLLARAKSSTTFYRLALLPGQAQLQAVNSGSVTVLGTAARTVSPGTILGYERNTTTNRYLTDEGIEILPVVGSELGRGRGGPRCMTCPIEREAVN